MQVKKIQNADFHLDPTVCIGDWGDGTTAGSIQCRNSNREAVQAAYDAIEEGDLGPNTLDGVIAAGGRYVIDEVE